jgi:hypothetical protein
MARLRLLALLWSSTGSHRAGKWPAGRSESLYAGLSTRAAANKPRTLTSATTPNPGKVWDERICQIPQDFFRQTLCALEDRLPQ